MIGDRYVPGARAVPARRARRQSMLAGSPAVAGRQRLARAVGSTPSFQLALAMICVAVAGLLYLAQASQASVLQFTIADLQAQQTQLQSQNASLHATAVQLQSLQRIDTAATQQLHMTKPDLSSAMWIAPVIPRATPVRPIDADTNAAVRASQPLAWMQHFLHVVKSSL